MKRRLFAAAVVAISLAAASESDATTVLYSTTFSGYAPGGGGADTATQIGTGDLIGYLGTVPGWTASGTNALYAVQTSTNVWAPMLYESDGQTNAADASKLTLSTGIAANNSGSNYNVLVSISPTAYNSASNVTKAGDGVTIQVVDAGHNVIRSVTYNPGAWSGSQNFQTFDLGYVGTGTGNVTYVIQSAAANYEFGGAVSSFTVSTPEPAAWSLMILGFGLVGGALRRKRAMARFALAAA